jgi:nucleoside-diphosphate-sugar epimerase
MKVLFIGGTGNISSEASKLCVTKGIDLYLLNRGKKKVKIDGANEITADISDLSNCREILKNHIWDVVVNWIAYTKSDVQNDIDLFTNKTKQYIFISSASAYQKPPNSPIITEATPLKNPFWQYSRDKIECENTLVAAHRNSNFPITIVRPSLTFDTVIPVPIGGWDEYTIVDRIKKGGKIIVHGDGTSLWTIMHSKDFAKGFVGLLGHQQAVGESFHITSDEILTWNQIYEYTANAVGKKANIIHIPTDFIGKYDTHLKESLMGDKAHSVIFDNSKIKKYVPGFEATIPYSEGIKKTITWFEEDPSRQIIKQETNDLIDRIIADYEIK